MNNFEPENIRAFGGAPRTFIDPDVSYRSVGLLDEPIPASFQLQLRFQLQLEEVTP